MSVASRKGRDRDTRRGGTKAAGVHRVLGADGSKRGRPSSVEDLFDGTQLRGQYQSDDVYAWFQKRHSKGNSLIDSEGVWRRDGHEWKVPYGVRCALKEKLTFTQIATKYPFFATWVSPKTGKRLRKYFMSLPAAIDFVASKAQYVDEKASVVSRHGFYIPTKLMGKFPRKVGRFTYYWCPRCMHPRRFHRTEEEFYANKKFLVWNDKARAMVWEWKNVKLAVMECTTCGITNRDAKFRASNQPVEKRKFKKGVTRAKRRRRKK